MPIEMLEIALIINEDMLPAWECWMLDQIQSAAGVRVAAVLLTPGYSPANGQVAHMLLKGLYKFDSMLFKCCLLAQEPEPFLPRLRNTPVLRMESREDCQAYMDGHKVDVVLNLIGVELDDTVLDWPRYGVWRYFFGNPMVVTDHFLGIREYISGQEELVSGIERQQSGGRESSLIFYATSSLEPVSLSRTLERVLWKMASAMSERLHELASVGEEQFFANARIRAASLPVRLVNETGAAGWAELGHLARCYTLNLLGKLYRLRFLKEQWILLVGEPGKVRELDALERFRKLVPPPDRFWADPFIVLHKGGYYIFFEEFPYVRGSGHLACIKLNEDGSHSDPIRILEKPYHLSYPFIFRYQDTYYMVPESAQNKTIELYRCEEFPHRWVFEKNLMADVKAYDSTLLEYQGRWWMFVNMRQHPACSSHETLYLFHADSPLSEDWIAHPQNPIVTRASRARPGGRIFQEDGKFYRPSQNCAGSYGRGLNLNLIQQLDEQVYRESTVNQCLPEGQYGLEGMHTLDSCPGMVVSDAVQIHKRFARLEKWLGFLSGAAGDSNWGLLRKRYIVLALVTTFAVYLVATY